MRTYERNGVHVDQCTECRGVFLDRGELERLVDAETRWYAGEPSRDDRSPDGRGTAAAPQGGGRSAQSSVGGLVNEVLQQVQSRQSSAQHGSKPRRKSSFLGDLLG